MANLEPDCTVDLICAGTETSSHTPCTLAAARWLSGSDDWMKISDDTGRGGVQAGFVIKGRESVYDLRCENCPRTIRIDVDQRATSIVAAWHQRQGSRGELTV